MADQATTPDAAPAPAAAPAATSPAPAASGFGRWMTSMAKAVSSAATATAAAATSAATTAASAASNGVSNATSWAKETLGFENLQVVKGSDKEEKENWTEQERQSLWKRLSELIGKDVVSMISLPVWVFEPMSFLQVMAEPLGEAELLNKAAAATDPYVALAYLAAFNCALYNRAVRCKKPFNPILGETFELLAKDGSYKFLAEQVSHHPPISVSQTSADAWSMTLETLLKSKLYPNSSEVYIEGVNHFHVNATNDHYTWGHLTTCAHNVLIGSMWIDHYGELTITNTRTGALAKIKFTQAGMLGGGRFEFTGEVLDASGAQKLRLFGKWNEKISYSAPLVSGQPEPEATVIWTAGPASDLDEKWHYSTFVRENLLPVTPEIEAVLPKTDSRVRTDRRLLAEGKIDLAGPEKYRLEELQRADAKARKEKKEEWVPRYFKKVDDEKHGYLWQQIGSYWEERAERVKNAPAAAPAEEKK